MSLAHRFRDGHHLAETRCGYRGNLSGPQKKWRNRLVHLKLDRDETGIRAYCIEPHDLSKLPAPSVLRGRRQAH